LNGKTVRQIKLPQIGINTFVTPSFRGDDILIEIEKRWKDGTRVERFKRRLHLEFDSTTYLLDQLGDYNSNGVFIHSKQTTYIRLN
jgi:hypothetical protein